MTLEEENKKLKDALIDIILAQANCNIKDDWNRTKFWRALSRAKLLIKELNK